MFFFYPIVLLLVSLFVTAAPVQKSTRYSDSTASQPVRWITSFGSPIPADTKVHLEWEGGSGQGFELYYIPQWPQQTEYYPVEIVSDLTQTHYTWHTPKLDEYPKGTSFIIGINDAVTALGSGWYDITGMVSFGGE